MSSSFFRRLEDRVRSSNSLLCIGLDPHSTQLPNSDPQSAIDFCKKIIEATHSYAAAFKPNSAFFEAFGAEGITALQQVIALIPEDIPVVLDVKRGDIETTAQAYATACYEVARAGAVTISPYMGWDSIQPFVTKSYVDKGAFILCKTSNPSSKDIQDQRLSDGRLVYQNVAQKCSEWNSNLQSYNEHGQSYASLGLVCGATDLPALESVRGLAPDVWILCPGVGAQGGSAMEVCSVGLRSDGSGLLVSVSRGISAAKDISEAARLLKEEINQCRETYLAGSKEFNAPATTKRPLDEEDEEGFIVSSSASSSASASSSSSVNASSKKVCQETGSEILDYQKSFIDFALGNRVLQFGSFKLKSGRISPYFFNAGLFCTGQALRDLGRYYAQAIKRSGLQFDVIFGPAYKGIPLATAVGVAFTDIYGESKDITYNRKEVKDHGEGGQLVGADMQGKRVLIVDDVITAGTAIRESVEILKAAKAILVGVAVSLDRQEMVSDTLRESAIQQVERDIGIPVIAIVRLRNLISFLSVTNSQSNDNPNPSTDLENIERYRQTYGVEY